MISPDEIEVMNDDSQEEIRILWQDEHYAFLYKPAGVLIHRSVFSSDRDTLVSRLQAQFEVPPFPVHRLDRPVSGVLAAAFTKEGASALSASFREGKVQKSYLAVVRGYAPEEGTADRELKNYDTGQMKEASTSFVRLATAELPVPSRRFPTSRYSLLKVSPHTGRFHQIRRHLAGLGYPIVGDTSHGDTFCNHHFAENFGVEGLLLHAYCLEFVHPVSGEALKIQAEPSQTFHKVFHRFGWNRLSL